MSLLRQLCDDCSLLHMMNLFNCLIILLFREDSAFFQYMVGYFRNLFTLLEFFYVQFHVVFFFFPQAVSFFHTSNPLTSCRLTPVTSLLCLNHPTYLLCIFAECLPYLSRHPVPLSLVLKLLRRETLASL